MEDEKMPPQPNGHIVKTEGICGGRACIAGHRIRVADIAAWHEKRGYAPDEIVQFFPGVTLGEVHSALAYYFDHRQEIEAELASDEAQAAQVNSSASSRLREKLGA
jgi:uncharacterized protein (DUF433 family)